MSNFFSSWRNAIIAFFSTILFGSIAVFSLTVYAQDLTSGLIGFWKFDEGSGTAALDSSGNGNMGTLLNGPLWVVGKEGNALDFDGSNNAVNAGSNANLDNPSAVSISAWIRPRNAGGQSFGRIVQKGVGSPVAQGFTLSMNNYSVANGMEFRVDYSSTDLRRISAANTIDMSGVWQHAVVTWDGSSSASGVKMYKNGTEVVYSSSTNASGSRVNDAASNLYIGNINTFGRAFNGAIDEVRVYNRVLTSQEVQELYSGVPPPPPPPPPPDTTPPTVSLTAPVAGSVFPGTGPVTVSASASDDVGVAGVEFFWDSTNLIADDTISPYAVSWDTPTVPEGSRTLTARARDAAGNQTTSTGVSVTIDRTPPSQPTGLSATAVSSSQINLSWTASIDNTSIANYRIYRCQGAGCTPTTQIATSLTTSYADSGLLASTTYTYTIEAVDAAGNVSSPSSPAAATTLAPPPPPPPGSDTVAPTAPRQVNVRPINSTTMEIAWFDSRDNGGVEYKIYRQVYGNSSTRILVSTSAHSGLGQVGFLDTTVSPSVPRYTYFVSAVDPSGNESSLATSVWANPFTLLAGNTINTAINYPSSVSPGGTIAITQTINCNPACTMGHHDVHWDTNMFSFLDAPGFDNFTSHSISHSVAATSRTSTTSITAPTTPGNFYFMEDGHLFGSGFPAGTDGHKEGPIYRIVVTSGSPLALNPQTLPGGAVGGSYSQTLTATGEGSGSYTWGVNEGALPPGLTISTGGTISGTPTQAGTYSFSIMVEDSNGTTAFRSYLLTI